MLDIIKDDVAPPALLFDYSEITDEREREATIQAAIEIKGHTRNTTERILQMGKLLLERKEALPHGTFQKWIEVEGDVSYRNAVHFMNVYTRFGGKSEIISLFSPSSLFLISGPGVSDEVIEGIVEEAKETGEKPTQAKVKATVAKHRPGPRALTVAECEAVIRRALGKVASDTTSQHQTLLDHADPEDYAQVLNGENVTMRRKEFSVAYENVKRRLGERMAPPAPVSKPSKAEGVQASNAREVYESPAKVEPEQPVRFIPSQSESDLLPDQKRNLVIHELLADIDGFQRRMKERYEENAADFGTLRKLGETLNTMRANLRRNLS